MQYRVNNIIDNHNDVAVLTDGDETVDNDIGCFCHDFSHHDAAIDTSLFRSLYVASRNTHTSSDLQHMSSQQYDTIEISRKQVWGRIYGCLRQVIAWHSYFASSSSLILDNFNSSTSLHKAADTAYKENI